MLYHTCLGCSITLHFLNLHLDIRDSYIFRWLSGLLRVEGKSLFAETRLAFARRQKAGNGSLGIFTG